MAKVNITQTKSRIGATKIQCRNLDALGLRKINKTVQHEDSKTIMGMLEKVRHLVKIEMNAAPVATKATKPATTKPATEIKAKTDAPSAKPAAEKKPATAKTPAATKKPAAAKTSTTTVKKPAAAPKKPAAKKPAATTKE